MPRADIEKVVLDAGQGLRIVVGSSEQDNFSFIYRAAARVRWDVTNRSLYMMARDDGSERTPLETFQQISRAVEAEYGDRLTINDGTMFVNLTSEDREAILLWYASLPES
jgi:hypothetical protein